MKLLLILLTIISGYLLININTFFIAISIIFFIIFVIIKRHKNDKKFIIFLAIIFVISLVYKNINFKTFQSHNSMYLMVIKRSNNYVILSDGIENFYFQTKDNFTLFSIIKCDANIVDYASHPLESASNFQKILNNSGVFRQIYLNSYNFLFKNPLDTFEYKELILSRLNLASSKEIIKFMLFDEYDYKSELGKNLTINGLSFFFSQSGIFISFLVNKFTKILSKKFSQKISIIVALILLIPLLVLNPNSLTLKRIILCNFLYVILGRNNQNDDSEIIDKFDVHFLTFSLLLINKYNINSYSFIIPLILIFTLTYSRHIIKSRSKITKKLKSTIIVFLVILPFSLEFNHSINLLNILINLVLLPFFSLVFLLIYPICFLIKFPFLNQILNFIGQIFKKINIRFAQINAPPFNQYLYVTYFIILFVIFYFAEAHQKRYFSYLSSAMFTFLLIYFLPVQNSFSSEIDFIYVGQGDSTLIRIKNKTYLIDTGGDVNNDIAVSSLIPFFKNKRIYKIDYVFITHYDVDHYYALESLKKYFHVGEIYDYSNISNYTGSLKMTNLNDEIEDAQDENDKSLVLYFNIKNNGFLIMGDSSKTVENKIISKKYELDVTYLKVGHHGSNTSSSLEFLSYINPKVAIISCGYKNKYNHPSKETLENLNKLNIEVRRTDLEGTISYNFY